MTHYTWRNEPNQMIINKHMTYNTTDTSNTTDTPYITCMTTPMQSQSTQQANNHSVIYTHHTRRNTPCTPMQTKHNNNIINNQTNSITQC